MFARSVRTALIAALLAASVVPAAAFASESGNGGQSSSLGDRDEFPMSGASFQRRVEENLAFARERLAARMERRGYSWREQERILGRFDFKADILRREVDRVAANGRVTREEAHRVHELSAELFDENFEARQ